MSAARFDNKPLSPFANRELIKTFLSLVVLGFAFAALFPGEVSAQFGKNKVQYKKFDWQVLKSEHFDIYFYGKERPMVLDAAKISERAYLRYSKMLNFKPKRRIPLMLYASHSDFSQTNILAGEIDEGLAGVNEFLKKRVILPFTGSWKDFEHTLTHELAHAFQIDVIWGDITPMYNPFSFMPPLWFIEGMVEQLSLDGMTPYTEMWLRDAALSGYLMTLEELNYMPDLRSYRFGHSFWYFIAQRYGNKKIGEILQKTPLFGNLDGAFKSSVGANLKTLGQQWNEDVRKTYLPQVVNFSKPEDFSRRLTDHTTDGSNYNVTPALNSTGEKIAFISNKSGYTDIWLASAIDGSNAKKIVEGQRSPDFESFRFLYTSLDWSPDDRFLTFVAKSGEEDAIYVYALFKKEVIEQFKFGLDGILTPSFSPDGEKIVFSGIDGGESNLYLVDIKTGKLTQLTADKYTQRDPVFSPDGKKIAFTTEYGPGTDLEKLIFSDYRIGILDLETGKYSILPNSLGDNISPQWSPDGDKLAYVSVRTGIQNIFYHDFADGQEYQVTDVLTGITGATEISPCISWSSSSGRLAFSAFFNAGWDIFVINSPERQAKIWKPDTTETFTYETVHLKARKALFKHLEEQEQLNSQFAKALSNINFPKEKEPLEKHPPFTPILESSQMKLAAKVLAGKGEKSDLETASQLQLTADTLKLPLPEDTVPAQAAKLEVAAFPGENPEETPPGAPADTLSAQAIMAGDSLDLKAFYKEDTAVALLDSAAAGADSLKVSQSDSLPSVSFDFDVPKEKIPMPDTTSFTFGKYKAKFSTDYVTGYGGYQNNLGISGGVLLSLSDQLGNRNILLGANIYGNIQDSDLMFQYINLKGRTDYGFFVTQFRDVYYLSTLRSGEEYLANIWRGGGVIFSRPFNRFRRIEWGLAVYSISQKTFEMSFYQYYYFPDLREHNVQKYGTDIFGGPQVALVFDNTAFGNTGPVDGSRYRLSAEQYLGDLSYTELIADWRQYWLLWRRVTFALRGIGATRLGRNPQVLYIGGPYTFRGAGYGDLWGTNLILGNMELRFPLIEHLVMGWPLPIYLRGIGGVFFMDIAGAWFKDEVFQPFTAQRSKFFRLQDAQAAYGFGIRINFGYTILRFDFAKSFDHYANNYYSFGNQVYESEELIKGRRRNFFSIGTDF
ncbi:MAG TPA: DPP IV N-terminal domain-containing protein [archaeon]|nr:DPP IV N-terminal domain-containing protein [archaeon]